MSPVFDQPPRPRGLHTARLSQQELSFWVQQVRRLPLARVPKIVAVREALREHRYDNEEILTATIDRLADEVALCGCRGWDAGIV